MSGSVTRFVEANGQRRVWAPNQRGYGKSSRPKGVASYRIDELVKDVTGWIDAAGARRVTLVGHDWGGLVAWEAAARAVRPLERLVILNAPHPMRLREELARNPAQRRRENILQPGAATAMLNWYRAAGRHFGRLGAPPIPIIETPTLLLWGEEDRALGKETSFGTERYVKELCVCYLPGVSHWVQQEAPERVNELLESWLDGTLR